MTHGFQIPTTLRKNFWTDCVLEEGDALGKRHGVHLAVRVHHFPLGGRENGRVHVLAFHVVHDDDPPEEDRDPGPRKERLELVVRRIKAVAVIHPDIRDRAFAPHREIRRRPCRGDSLEGEILVRLEACRVRAAPLLPGVGVLLDEQERSARFVRNRCAQPNDAVDERAGDQEGAEGRLAVELQGPGGMPMAPEGRLRDERVHEGHEERESPDARDVDELDQWKEAADG